MWPVRSVTRCGRTIAHQNSGAARALSLLLVGVCSVSAHPFQGCLNISASRLPYCNASLPYRARVRDLVRRLELAEKLSLLSPSIAPFCGVHTRAVPRLGVPLYRWLTETNTGVMASCVSVNRCPTTFIGPQGMAASFNRSSWWQKGDVTSTDMRAVYNSFVGDPYSATGLTGWGPNINLVKDPRWGRNSEVPGEDTLLSGEYARHFTNGIQQTKPGRHGEPVIKMRSYLKHYTAYSVEQDRLTFSANVTAFDLHDSNTPHFKAALTQGNSSGVMCSYFAPNGVSACGNPYLLNELLRETWGRADALVMSDCGAIENLRTGRGPLDDYQKVATAMNAGMDLYAGGGSNLYGDGHLETAVKRGLSSVAAVDAAVERVLAHRFSLGLFDSADHSPWRGISVADLNSTHSRQVAYEAGLQGTVLLANQAGALPLSKGAKLGIVGPLSNDSSMYLSSYAAATGAWSPSIWEALGELNTAGTVDFCQGVGLLRPVNAHAVDEALGLVNRSEAVVLALGITREVEREALDRANTTLPPGQQELALKIIQAAGSKPVVIVLVNGGILSIDDLVDAAKGKRVAFIEAFNPSQQGSRALAALMFGDENRWGKLPVTIYRKDYAATRTMQDMTFTNRSYRYYTGEALFPFGHGLSLTTFSHTECACSRAVTAGFDCACEVSNTGSAVGDEVLLVYHAVSEAIRAVASKLHPVPIRRLVDFARFRLEPGGKAKASFSLPGDVLAITTADGNRTVYEGAHNLIFSRGDAATDVVVDIEALALT